LNNFQLSFFVIGFISLRRRTRAFRLQDSRQPAAQERVEIIKRPHADAAAAATSHRKHTAIVVRLPERTGGLEPAVRGRLTRRQEAALDAHRAVLGIRPAERQVVSSGRFWFWGWVGGSAARRAPASGPPFRRPWTSSRTDRARCRAES
jgi:hypothetical protein